MTDLATMCARVRGLATHVFPRAELEELSGMDPSSLARALGRSGRFEPIPLSGVAAIESAIRRTSAARLRVLARWTPEPILDVFHADEERRAIRALLRGALEGAPKDDRLAGLLPSPRLPEAALVALAREPTPGKVAAHLFVLGHPDARALLDVAGGVHPGLLDMELVLLRGFSERAARAASAGDANMRRYVTERVDVLNVETALLLAAGPRDVEPKTCFVKGGAWLSVEAFVRATGATTASEAATRLARALEGTPLAPLIDGETEPAAIERRALGLALAEQRRVMREEPLGSATLLWFMARLRAESSDSRRVAWGAALGAPAAVVRSELVTPWS